MVPKARLAELVATLPKLPYKLKRSVERKRRRKQNKSKGWNGNSAASVALRKRSHHQSRKDSPSPEPQVASSFTSHSVLKEDPQDEGLSESGRRLMLKGGKVCYLKV